MAGLPVHLDHVRQRMDGWQAISQLLQLTGKVSRRPRPGAARFSQSLRPRRQLTLSRHGAHPFHGVEAGRPLFLPVSTIPYSASPFPHCRALA
jgi:hypothetical protein